MLDDTVKIMEIIVLFLIAIFMVGVICNFDLADWFYTFRAWINRLKTKWKKPAPWPPRPVRPQKPYQEFTALLDSIVTALDAKRRVLVIVPTMDLLYFTQGFVLQRNSSYIPALFHSGTSPGQRREAMREALLVIGTLQTLSQGFDLSGFDELIFVGCNNGKVCEQIKASYEAHRSLNHSCRVSSVL
jgi:hypothetical protein